MSVVVPTIVVLGADVTVVVVVTTVSFSVLAGVVGVVDTVTLTNRFAHIVAHR